MTDFKNVHSAIGLEVGDLHDGRGRVMANGFRVEGNLAFIVGWLKWLLFCLFGGPGIVIRRSERRPMVLLDWDTYVRMSLGLKREELPDMTVFADGEQ